MPGGRFVLEHLGEEYTNLIREFADDGSERVLYKASKLSKGFVEQGLGPEDIVDIHMHAVEQVISENTPLKAPQIILNSFSLLLESMMAYGLAHREYIESKSARFSDLEAYAHELETLNSALKQRINELSVLYDLTQVVNSSLDLQTTLRVIAEKLMEVTEYDTCNLYLAGNEAEEFQIQLSMGVNAKAYQAYGFNSGHWLIEAALENRAPLVFQDVKREPRWQPIKGVNDHVQSWMSVPLIAEGKPIGIITLSSSEVKAISEAVLKLTSIAASQAASAIERARLYEETKRLSITDEKTGLYNFGHFKFLLGTEMKRARRYGRPLSLFMIDLDDFKIYNDLCGHLDGDQVLEQLGKTIKQSVRDVDFPARYGGDEFAVILPETDETEAYAAAERLRECIEQCHVPNQAVLPGGKLTVSIGMSSYPTFADTKDDLIRNADAALYQAKRDGKNKVVMWLPTKDPG
jgi:diguanylate cyclase (GGDEF)-like protein